jgi:diguanylate cyclase (GGDEF)-like protein
MSDSMSRVRALFAASEDPYAGGDIATARRMGALVWLTCAGIVLVLAPLAAPSAAIGTAGWPLIAAGIAAGVLWAARLARSSRRVGWNQLLRASYLATAAIALLQWLGGEAGATAYGELYLVIVIYTGATHPPRRVVGVLGAVAVAACLPLVYGERSSELVAQTATRLLLWSALALIGSAMVGIIRAQRTSLRERAESAEELVRVDELTSLPNRRAFKEALPTEISRARRLGASLCLVVADINRFTALNDRHGRPAGDECLQAVAEALRDEMRQHDACFRWGGDEFALLLPGTTRTEADAACERLADAVASRCRRPDGTALGIACAATQLTEGMTGEDFIRAGDAALLALKGTGRPRLRAV